MWCPGATAHHALAMGVPVQLNRQQTTRCVWSNQGPAVVLLRRPTSAVSQDEKMSLPSTWEGTTAKAILSRDGEFPVSTRSEVARVYRFKRGSGLPLLVPVLDMVEIGAGGGSIARLNELGLPQVGPESAGASPGPACYDRGGSAPTVTDADLVLGYLDPSYFLGGQMSLNTSAARRAIGALAGELDSDVEHSAWGIFQIVNENMANAARVHAAERGVDLRGYAMVATGGAGPVHACPVAARLGIKTVVVPRLPASVRPSGS